MQRSRIVRDLSAGIAFAVAAALRIASAGFIDMWILHGKDGLPGILMEYGIIARNILAGNGFAYTWTTLAGQNVTLQSAYMPPGQVWIDTVCMRLFGQHEAGIYAIFAVNVIFGLTAVYYIWQTTRIIFGSERIGRLALWFAALYPPFVYSTATFGVTSAVTALNGFILFECVRAVQSSRRVPIAWGNAVRIGLGFGALLYFRGEAPLLIAATAVYLLWVCRKNLSVTLPKIAAMVLIAGALVAPWTIRNYFAFDRFILTSTNGGFNFYRGNNPTTTGSAWEPGGKPVWGTDEQWRRAEGSMTSGGEYEQALSRIFFDDATAWIRSHPADAAKLSLKKGLIFWTIDRMSPMGSSAAYISVYLATLAMFIVAVTSLIRSKTRASGVGAIVVWTAIATLVAMVFFPMPRLQVIMIAGYFPLVAYGADRAWALVMRTRVTQ